MEYKNGQVLMKCPKCKGVGGPFEMDGTQIICSECRNRGYISFPLSDVVKDIEKKAIKNYRKNVLISLKDIQKSAYVHESLQNYIEQLTEEGKKNG